MSFRRLALTAGVVAIVLAASIARAPGAQARESQDRTGPSAAACASTVGPGIPPPATVQSNLPGFHAAWYGQSGYMTLCPGDTATATVAMYNSGSFGWVSGVLGQVAYLGTWDPTPGRDQPSTLGGDGTFGSPNTGWPRYNRPAVQPASYVGPGQVAWFQFSVKAPTMPGSYGFYIRPLIEGAQWMEDFGIFWRITVPTPPADTTPPTVTGAQTPNAGALVVSFSEPMRCTADGALASISTGIDYLIATYPGGSAVAETITATPNAACTQATLTLSNPLTLTAVYTVTVNYVQDVAGNVIDASAHSAIFTASDNGGAPTATVAATGPNQITVTYSKPMDTSTTGNLGNYRLDSIPCTNVCSGVSTTSTSAVLTLNAIPSGGSHAFDLFNVKDSNGITISPNPTSVSLTFPSASTRPTVTGATATSSTSVTVSYSTSMEPGSTQTTGNYTILSSAGGTYSAISSAVCSPSTTSCTSVILTLATALVPGSYSVQVIIVRDTFGNVINPNPTIRAFSF